MVLSFLPQHSLKRDTPNGPAGHGRAYITLEGVAVRAKVLSSFFVKGIGGIRLKEKELQGPDYQKGSEYYVNTKEDKPACPR